MLTVLIITWHLGAKITETSQQMTKKAYTRLQSLRNLNYVEDEYNIPVLDGTEVKLA